MSKRGKRPKIGKEEDLGNNRRFRTKLVGNTMYGEVLENGIVVQSNEMARLEGRTIVIEQSLYTGNGPKLPPVPCPECGSPMEHDPSVCTKWLPNGTYLCRCGVHWLGTPGFIDEAPVSVPRGTRAIDLTK
jgi:hypothetical protein